MTSVAPSKATKLQRRFVVAQTKLPTTIYRQLFWLTVAVFAASIGHLAQAASAQDPEVRISVSWKLIGNDPESHFKAQLTLRNEGHTALANDWALYFNSASKLSLTPESAQSEYALAHVNGDLYVLRPSANYKSIEPGKNDVISLEGSPWAINISDAPSGFFVVLGARADQSEKSLSVPLTIEPFPAAAKLRRGAADLVPVVTAESRYLENESLTKLPSEQLVNVVPTPVEIKPLPGQVELRNSSRLFFDSALSNEAKIFARSMEPLITGKMEIKEGIPSNSASVNEIRLRVGKFNVAGVAKQAGDEAYVLTISPENGIEIIGSDRAGVFYGIQTLRALIPVECYRQLNDKVTLNAVQIADAPRFKYRGLHLDVARSFQSKQTVEKLLDLMAFYKLNRFHWHLTDDEAWRIEIKKLPELTSVGSHRGYTEKEADRLIPSQGSGPDPNSKSSSGNGFYTQDDFVEILRYAQSRHIAVIPELDFPGHSRAAIKAMEARQRALLLRDDRNAADEFLLRDPSDESKYESVQMWRDNVVDVGREVTYRFLEAIVGELLAVYQRAGVPLTMVHLGGDEVPEGAWEKSPACKDLGLDANANTPRRAQLEIHFLNRAAKLLADHSIQPACWEDCLLVDTDRDRVAGNTRRAAGKPVPVAYVWNNVWGWGREDAAYRLANAGFDVVLCNATHLYFDLACEKDPLEPGYYWAGFVGARAPFEFVPLDVFKNADRNSMGQPVSADSLSGRARLTPEGEQHVLGIQGQLWGENLRDPRGVEYMGFPRIIALAERAWARSPTWAQTADAAARRSQLDRDWNQFANRLGQRELPRLDYLDGGVNYRIPPPGAIVRDGQVWANVSYPGFEIHYTLDGTEPDATAALYRGPVSLAPKLKLKSFGGRGRRSRTTYMGTASGDVSKGP